MCSAQGGPGTRARRRLVLAWFCLGLLLALAGCAAKKVSGARLAEGNREYEAGQYEQAASLYEALVREGVADGIVHYNLGNAYFKMDELGRAISSYRRAQRLLPRDPDVTANLALARGQTIDRLEVGAQGAVTWVEQLLIGWNSLGEAASAALVSWALLCALACVAIVRPRRTVWQAALAVVAVLTLVSVLSLGLHWRQERLRTSAVVVVDEVQVTSGPGQDYLEAFLLHAGAEVRVVEERGGWARIALPGDLQGWLPAHTVEKI